MLEKQARTQSPLAAPTRRQRGILKSHASLGVAAQAFEEKPEFPVDRRPVQNLVIAQILCKF
jgi:hypothetical protein